MFTAMNCTRRRGEGMGGIDGQCIATAGYCGVGRGISNLLVNRTIPTLNRVELPFEEDDAAPTTCRRRRLRCSGSDQRPQVAVPLRQCCRDNCFDFPIAEK